MKYCRIPVKGITDVVLRLMLLYLDRSIPIALRDPVTTGAAHERLGGDVRIRPCSLCPDY